MGLFVAVFEQISLALEQAVGVAGAAGVHVGHMVDKCSLSLQLLLWLMKVIDAGMVAAVAVAFAVAVAEAAAVVIAVAIVAAVAAFVVVVAVLVGAIAEQLLLRNKG